MKKKYSLSRARYLIELFVRVALSLALAIAAANYFRNAFLVLSAEDFLASGPQKMGYALTVVLVGMNALCISILYVMRLPPVTPFAGVWPSLAALFGGFSMAGLFFFTPRGDLPLWAQSIAMVLVVTGNSLSLFVMSVLGRSFSILPEGRRLVTRGPYAFVRHPLYLAEALATMGMVITFLSFPAFALMILQFSLQLVRIYFEEKVLKEAFPEYKSYAKRTWRIVPGIY